MVMDQSYMIFCAALSEIARSTHKAGINSAESELFLKRIYGEYLQASMPAPEISWIKSVPKKIRVWMTDILNDNLLYMNEKPEWVREPAWRFIDDRAMIFISQVEFDDNEIMNENLSSGDVIYIFSSKKKVEDGWELIIKMVKQDRNSVGTSFIN